MVHNHGNGVLELGAPRVTSLSQRRRFNAAAGKYRPNLEWREPVILFVDLGRWQSSKEVGQGEVDDVETEEVPGGSPQETAMRRVLLGVRAGDFHAVDVYDVDKN